MTTHTTLSDYLHAIGSLTALLEQKAGRPLRVQIIAESYQPIDLYHKKLLGLPAHRPCMAWVRDVLLYGDDSDKPWVQAKSIFPIGTLRGRHQRLRHLKGTPIGYVLFKKRRNIPHQRHYFSDDGQQGRQTVYVLDDGRIMIQELFLYSFEQVLSR